jgi:hypothetical protein
MSAFCYNMSAFASLQPAFLILQLAFYCNMTGFAFSITAINSCRIKNYELSQADIPALALTGQLKDDSFVLLINYSLNPFSMKRLNLGFRRYTDAALLVEAQAILAALTGNAFFPTPTPTLPALESAIEAYMTALSAAQEGGKTDVATKNARKLELVDLLIQLGNYVMLTANGDEVMLVSSGIPVTKDRQPLPPLGTPEILKIENGINSGELLMTIAALPGARTYVYQYALDPLTDESSWVSNNSTLVKFSFSNLEAGKKYWFRVVAYGRNEQVVYSNPLLSKIVQ